MEKESNISLGGAFISLSLFRQTTSMETTLKSSDYYWPEDRPGNKPVRLPGGPRIWVVIFRAFSSTLPGRLLESGPEEYYLGPEGYYLVVLFQAAFGFGLGQVVTTTH